MHANNYYKVCMIRFIEFLLTFFCLACFSLSAQPKPEFSSLLESINQELLLIADNVEQIPGLEEGAYKGIKDGLKQHWHCLYDNGILELRGTDQEVRPFMVSLQGLLEHILANKLNGEIKALRALIHTPMPPTPLCMKDIITEQLVDPSLHRHRESLFTVKARSVILREFLKKGGKLFAAYPKANLYKRTEEQRGFYQAALKQFPNLIDVPLALEELPYEYVGAIYIFEDAKGHEYAFAIQITQANAPHLAPAAHRLWFAPISNPAIAARIEQVLQFIEPHFIKSKL